MIYGDSSDPWSGLWGVGGQSKKLASSFDFHLDQLSRGTENDLQSSPRRMRAVAWAKSVYSCGGGIFIVSFNIKEVWRLGINPDNQHHLRKAGKGLHRPGLLRLQMHSVEAAGNLMKMQILNQ